MNPATTNPVKETRMKIMHMVDGLPDTFTAERALIFMAELDEVLTDLYQKGYANSIKPNRN